MIQFIKKVTKYGKIRRHIEVPKDCLEVIKQGDIVMVTLIEKSDIKK